jgi:hypothetical protein
MLEMKALDLQWVSSLAADTALLFLSLFVSSAGQLGLLPMRQSMASLS